MHIDWLFIVSGIFFGLLLGSFLNVVVYRLPQTSASGLRSDNAPSLLYLAWPPSFCPRCKTPIRPWNNIPLLSFLLLGGRASCCREKIDWRYPLMELFGVVIVFAAFLRYQNSLDAAFVVVFLSMALVMSAIDCRRFYLLDILTLPLLWLGLLANIDARFALLPDAVLGAAGGYVFLAALVALCSLAIGRPAMGGGDFKLFAALGAWLGWQMLPMLLFVAAILGVFVGAGRRFSRGRWRRVPFGPCLAAAGTLMLFYGDEIMLMYWNFVHP